MPGASSFHEQFDRPKQVKASSDRAFGVVIVSAASAIAAVKALLGDATAIWWLIAAVPFALTAWLCPKVLTPLNRAWLRFGRLLHRIVSPLILALIFYLIVVPVGLLMRLSGKDPLRLTFEPEAASYWIPRTPPGPAPDSMHDQF